MVKIQSPADAARLIKTQRLRRELTQSDVAAAIGVTRQSYARIEQAHGGASFATYLKIFAFLGIVLRGEVSQAGASVDADDLRGGEAGATTPAAFPRDRLYGLGQEAAQAALERLRSSGVLASAVDQAAEATRGLQLAVNPNVPALDMDAVNRLLAAQSTYASATALHGARHVSAVPQGHDESAGE